MSNNAIYFPYINVPNTNWFHQVLLYWDKINSIVPSEYIRNPSELSQHMRDLVTSGLVIPIQPMDYIYNIPNFTNAFLKYVDHSLELFEINNTNRKRYHNKLSQEPVQLIHIEKIQNIAEELQQRGLAFPTIYPWYALHNWVSKAFMAYLAACLGRINEIDADPVTNEYQSALLFTAGAKNQGNIQYRRRRSDTRQLILSQLLPSPRHHIPLNEIIKFKDKHGEQLRAFRELVEKKCINLAAIEDDQARYEQINNTLSEMRQEMHQISEMMRNRWRGVIFHNIIPLLTIGASSVSIDYSQPIPLIAGLTATSLSLTQAVYQAFSYQNEQRLASQKPIAYVIQANYILSQS